MDLFRLPVRPDRSDDLLKAFHGKTFTAYREADFLPDASSLFCRWESVSEVHSDSRLTGSPFYNFSRLCESSKVRSTEFHLGRLRFNQTRLKFKKLNAISEFQTLFELHLEARKREIIHLSVVRLVVLISKNGRIDICHSKEHTRTRSSLVSISSDDSLCDLAFNPRDSLRSFAFGGRKRLLLKLKSQSQVYSCGSAAEFNFRLIQLAWSAITVTDGLTIYKPVRPATVFNESFSLSGRSEWI